ncbi:MAG: hypothetical protein HOK72_00480 [Flavobacteriales bacterium]|nr:hypothetical protein [Flavobacteriales bacterium]
MTLPVIRRYTLAAPAALNTFNNLVDDVTGQAQFLLLSKNAIIDMTNDPDPAAGLRYEFVLNKNGLQTPVSAFSSAISPATAGRVAIGPVSLNPGNFIWSGAQRAGALTATSVIVKYAVPLN